MKLNLGCGSRSFPGYVNVDHPRTITPKDVAHDLNILPWPFESNSADEILMRDSLEHLTFPDEKLVEIHRILKKNGLFHGGVPYAFGDGAYYQLEHRWFFTELSFDAYCEGSASCDYLGSALFRKEYVRLVASRNTPKTFLRWLIPGRPLLRHFIRNMYDEVEFKLIKV
jgi:ubiquinone/menaquinone biosynthesis C-methylase UbiE